MAEEKPSRKRTFPEGVDLDKPSSTTHKRVRFPKGKKVKPGEEVVGTSQTQTQDGGRDDWNTDPRLAAKARAKRRSQMTTELCAEENTEVLSDITAAEVNYEDHEKFVDDGIQIEPFNLEKEREEGYFDAEGNFVEYVNNNEIKDAWLESIEVDPNFVGRVAKTEDNQDGTPDLSSVEIGKIKRRIADVLEPGETVLNALKRLKGTSKNRKEKMPPEIKVLFDQLTEDAVKLLENGDYNVYHERKEVFEHEAEGYETLAQAAGEYISFENANSGPAAVSVLANADVHSSTGEISSSNGADTFDMFADDDETSIDPPADAGTMQSDYLYDESSGYYYSSSLGYYYDPSSKLYCCASSGQWYAFNEDTGVYEEIHEAAAA